MEMSLCDPDLVTKAETIAKSIQVILSPVSSSSDRANAQAYYDRIRVSHGPSDLCALGVILVSSKASAEVVQAGLRFIQETVKYHWAELPLQQRISMKEMFMTTMAMEDGGTVFTIPYLQEAMAKAIVEMAKKEWPQLWPDFFSEMTKLSEHSDVPLLIFRRLVEDVVSLDTIESHDRKTELFQSLNLTASDLLHVLFRSLQESVLRYTTTNDIPLCRRVKLLLSVIAVYFDWVNTSAILADGRICQLIDLLKVKPFQCEALECLQQIMERKGTKKEAEVTREFLKFESCQSIMSSITACERTNSTDQEFLHKLGDLLCLLGTTAHKCSTDQVTVFRHNVMMLANHGDIRAQGLAALAFCNLVKNIERMPEPKPMILSIEELIFILIMQFLEPPNPADKAEMIVLKQNLVSLLRAAARLDKNLYSFVSGWFHDCLQNRATVSARAHQWEVIAFVIDAVAPFVPFDSDELVKLGRDDLRDAMTRFDVADDLTIKSAILSVVSSLFVFLQLTRKRGNFPDSHWKLIMDKIFTMVFALFTPGEISEAQFGLRNHAASLMIKLAIKFPDMLMTVYNSLNTLATTAMPNMRHMEIQYITECFFVLSNSWKDYDRQKQLVERALQADAWADMNRVLQSGESFLSFFEESGFVQRKNIVSHNLHMLYAALRRIQPIGLEEESRVHAAYDAGVVLLPIVFQLVKMLYLILESPQFHAAMDLTESEKGQVLGIMCLTGAFSQTTSTGHTEEAEDTYRSAVIKFVRGTLEMCYGILGMACTLFSPKLYSIPNIEDSFLGSVGWKMSMLPDYRVRNIVHNVFKPFLHCCPTTGQTTVLLPFLRAFCPFMFERLNQRWNAVQQAAFNNPEGDEESEILDSATLRLLTRDYLDCVQGILEGTNPKKDYLKQLGFSQAESTGEMDVDMNDEDVQGSSDKSKSQNSTGLCAFGTTVLTDPTCYQSIIHLCGVALCWDDSTTVLRAAKCLIMSFDHVALHMNIVLGVLLNSLSSICTWMENEAAKEILARLIDLIHKRYQKEDVRINQMMLEWGASEEDLKKLGGSASDGQKNDKRRKDIIRQMVKNNPRLELRNSGQKPSWLDMPKLMIQKQKLEDGGAEELNDCFALACSLYDHNQNKILEDRQLNAESI